MSDSDDQFDPYRAAEREIANATLRAGFFASLPQYTVLLISMILLFVIWGLAIWGAFNTPNPNISLSLLIAVFVVSAVRDGLGVNKAIAAKPWNRDPGQARQELKATVDGIPSNPLWRRLLAFAPQWILFRGFYTALAGYAMTLFWPTEVAVTIAAALFLWPIAARIITDRMNGIRNFLRMLTATGDKPTWEV